MSGVLKILDDEIASLPKMASAIRFAGAKYGWRIDESEPVRRLEEARAAVAELIEAAEDASSAFTADAAHPFIARIRTALRRVKGERE